MAVVLDAGALLLIDAQDREIGAMLRVAQQRAIPVRTSAAVVAQVWRNGARQANLARSLAGVDTRDLDGMAARRIGELLGQADAADVVDAHVALLTNPGDRVVTSDEDDIARLLDTRNVKAGVVAVRRPRRKRAR